MNIHKKRISYLSLLLFLFIILSSCATSNVYREYSGENENYKINLSIKPEYDGDIRIPRNVAYNDEKLSTALYYEIEYKGNNADNLQIIQFDLGIARGSLSRSTSEGYLSLFKNNKYNIKIPSQGLDLNEHDYFAEFTYSDGTKEKIDLNLVYSKGDITDLKLDVD